MISELKTIKKLRFEVKINHSDFFLSKVTKRVQNPHLNLMESVGRDETPRLTSHEQMFDNCLLLNKLDEFADKFEKWSALNQHIFRIVFLRRFLLLL